MTCEVCNEVQMTHCSDPCNCGGPWDDMHPHLMNRADGITGHFHVRKRLNDKMVYWKQGDWGLEGELYLDYDAAITALAIAVAHEELQ